MRPLDLHDMWAAARLHPRAILVAIMAFGGGIAIGLVVAVSLWMTMTLTAILSLMLGMLIMLFLQGSQTQKAMRSMSRAAGRVCGATKEASDDASPHICGFGNGEHKAHVCKCGYTWMEGSKHA